MGAHNLYFKLLDKDIWIYEFGYMIVILQASLVGAHNAGYNNNKIRLGVDREILGLK